MKLYNRYLKITGLLLVSLSLLFFSSCKDSVVTETNLGTAHLTVINGAASTSAINIYSTGNKLNTVPLVYGNTTGYKNITSGIRDIQVKANASNMLLATNTLHLVRDSSYTLFVLEANRTTATVVTQDDLSAPSFGNAKVKFANMSSGLSSADFSISNGPDLASSISFGTIGSYSELKAGTYNLVLRVHGSTTTLLDIPNIRMDNGRIYTIWSSGSVGGKGTAAVSVQTITQ
jgi:hypothetical protein